MSNPRVSVIVPVHNSEEYLAEWRRSVLDTLENTYIVDEKGHKRKLKKK